jgi:hypothetical protein
MTVPNRPAAGALVDSAWGQLVHDAVVAQDIQAGLVNVVASSDASAAVEVVFPRPFASAPIVLVSQDANSAGWIAYAGAIDAKRFDANVATKAGNAASGTIPVAWLAIGPRA